MVWGFGTIINHSGETLTLNSEAGAAPTTGRVAESAALKSVEAIDRPFSGRRRLLVTGPDDANLMDEGDGPWSGNRRQAQRAESPPLFTHLGNAELDVGELGYIRFEDVGTSGEYASEGAVDITWLDREQGMLTRRWRHSEGALLSVAVEADGGFVLSGENQFISGRLANSPLGGAAPHSAGACSCGRPRWSIGTITNTWNEPLTVFSGLPPGAAASGAALSRDIGAGTVELEVGTLGVIYVTTQSADNSVTMRWERITQQYSHFGGGRLDVQVNGDGSFALDWRSPNGVCTTFSGSFTA